jgi:parvulin-like peptidyl-prolyl isomerase
MTSQNNKMAILALAGVVSALLVGSSWALHLGPFASEDHGSVIATVDGRPIYFDDARSRVEGLSTMHGSLETSLGSHWYEQVFQSLVDDKIIQADAERRGIGLTDQEIANEVLRLQGMFSSVTEYQGWLDSQGIDQDELQRRIALQGVATRVYEAVTSNVGVSDQELRAYYEAHPGRFRTADGELPPFEDVAATVEQVAMKEKKDGVYADWLDQQRRSVDVVVVMKDWWRSVENEQQG